MKLQLELNIFLSLLNLHFWRSQLLNGIKMNSNTLTLISKPLNKLLLILILIPAIFCDGKPTRQDLKNAATIGKTLRNNKSSASKSFKHYPQGEHGKQDSYTVQKHILKSGETLQDLAVQYGTDWQSIQQANGIKNLNDLKPGQVILIPIKKTGQQ